MFDELITKDQLLASPWQEVIDGCDEQACSNFYSALSAKVQEVGEGSDHRVPLQLLESVCSMYLAGYREKGKAFGPMWVFEGRRTFLPEDLKADQADELFAFMDHVETPDLKARIADTIWVSKQGKHKFEAAKIAIAEYIKAGLHLLDDEHPIRAVERLERAVAIAAELGRGGVDERAQALAACWDGLRKLGQAEINACQYRLIQTIFRFEEGKPLHLAGFCFDLSEKAELGATNWDLTRSYWELTAKLFGACGQERVAVASRKRQAWSYLQQARAAGSNIIKANVLARAIEAFRRIGERKYKIDLLHRWLLRIEGLTYQEMHETTVGPVDLTEYASASQKQVSGKSITDALVAFGLITQPSDPDRLKEQAVEHSRKYVLSSLVGGSYLNSQGKVIAKKPPAALDQDTPDEDALLPQMHSDFAINCGVQVQGAIQPARRQLLREHSLSTEDLWPVVSNSPFVPKGREMIFARGLAAGFEGDFLVAMHLLVPQIENSLRMIIEQGGGLTSNIDPHGIQQERTVSSLLDDPLAEEALGKSIVFCLKALLIEKTGDNFRHNLCHALMDDGHFYTYAPVFIWWLVFRLCYTPWISNWLKKMQLAKQLLNVLQQLHQKRKSEE